MLGDIPTNVGPIAVVADDDRVATDLSTALRAHYQIRSWICAGSGSVRSVAEEVAAFRCEAVITAVAAEGLAAALASEVAARSQHGVRQWVHYGPTTSFGLEEIAADSQLRYDHAPAGPEGYASLLAALGPPVHHPMAALLGRLPREGLTDPSSPFPTAPRPEGNFTGFQE